MATIVFKNRACDSRLIGVVCKYVIFQAFEIYFSDERMKWDRARFTRFTRLSPVSSADAGGLDAGERMSGWSVDRVDWIDAGGGSPAPNLTHCQAYLHDFIKNVRSLQNGHIRHLASKNRFHLDIANSTFSCHNENLGKRGKEEWDEQPHTQWVSPDLLKTKTVASNTIFNSHISHIHTLLSY